MRFSGCGELRLGDLAVFVVLSGREEAISLVPIVPGEVQLEFESALAALQDSDAVVMIAVIFDIQ